MTKQLSPEQLAMQSYIKYTSYIKVALDRGLTGKEYSKAMEFYISGCPVKEAVNKMEKK